MLFGYRGQLRTHTRHFHFIYLLLLSPYLDSNQAICALKSLLAVSTYPIISTSLPIVRSNSSSSAAAWLLKAKLQQYQNVYYKPNHTAGASSTETLQHSHVNARANDKGVGRRSASLRHRSCGGSTRKTRRRIGSNGRHKPDTAAVLCYCAREVADSRNSRETHKAPDRRATNMKQAVLNRFVASLR